MKARQIKIAVTGGPCCGKTTLLNNLAAQSYTAVPESARMIIEESLQADSNCVPWFDLFGFQLKVAEKILELESSFEDSVLFCDRGIIDGRGFCVNGKVPTPEIIGRGLRRYDAVFILDPVPIYQKDESRKESQQEAVKIHRAIWDAYKEFGYTPIRVPIIGSPEERTLYFSKLAGEIV